MTTERWIVAYIGACTTTITYRETDPTFWSRNGLTRMTHGKTVDVVEEAMV